jgi:hypothetical protein
MHVIVIVSHLAFILMMEKKKFIVIAPLGDELDSKIGYKLLLKNSSYNRIDK